jgi:hypothetical protein
VIGRLLGAVVFESRAELCAGYHKGALDAAVSMEKSISR